MHLLVGLVVAFVLIALLSNRRTRRCRWRMDRSRNKKSETFYHCAACGAEVFTKDGKPPNSCYKT